jgi:hypothetical protein
MAVIGFDERICINKSVVDEEKILEHDLQKYFWIFYPSAFLLKCPLQMITGHSSDILELTCNERQLRHTRFIAI